MLGKCCRHQVPFTLELIYSFHMPVLFTLSGFVAAWWREGTRQGCRVYGWAGRRVVRSAWRLLVPYVLFGAIVLPLVAVILGHTEHVMKVWREFFVLWLGFALVFATYPHTLVSNLIKPVTGLAIISPLAFVAHHAKRIPCLIRVGESTLTIYCIEAAVGSLLFTWLSPSHAGWSALWSLAFVLVVSAGRVRGTRN